MPRYLDEHLIDPPDLYADEPECPECGDVLEGDYCPTCDETFNEDTLRDAAEATAEPEEDHYDHRGER